MSETAGDPHLRPDESAEIRLVLASASPRRTALLTEWGLQHEIVVPLVEEVFEPQLAPEVQAARLALRKAEDVRDRLSAADPVLAADTIVVESGRQLAKPRDDEDALEMLMSLSGRELEVVTGVALARRGSPTRSAAETTRLIMRDFDRAEATAYVATGEPRGKAGAFAIQGRGGRLIADCIGSFSNVVGLPRKLVFDLLERDARTPREL